jgi:DNA-directed RNA polymerase specialized sigma subunit
MNPLDDYQTTRQKHAAVSRADDHELWKTWKQNPAPHTLEPLLKRFDPVIGQRLSMWNPKKTNKAAMQATLQGLAIKAFETYDPSKAGLNTHVQTTLQRGQRFMHRTQNMAYIPEGKVEQIGPIKKAIDTLSDDLGRPPTPSEIASHMNQSLPASKHFTPRGIQEIQQRQYADLFESGLDFDPIARESSREQEVLGLLRPTLKPEHHDVFDHLYGLNNKARITSTGDIAKRLGKSPSQVSRIKKSIETQYRKYY